MFASTFYATTGPVLGGQRIWTSLSASLFAFLTQCHPFSCVQECKYPQQGTVHEYAALSSRLCSSRLVIFHPVHTSAVGVVDCCDKFILIKHTVVICPTVLPIREQSAWHKTNQTCWKLSIKLRCELHNQTETNLRRGDRELLL